jgi:peptidoglycan/xylan/chitin deacetylase (PgdA/CDA1 family)
VRLKETIIRAARAVGGFAAVRNSPWRRRRLLILCYHGVSMDDEHVWDPALFITQDQLRRRLRALRDGGYEILPLAEATRRLYDGTLPPRSVALTFDDGTVDFEQRALPVLREFNAPATLYLTTYYCKKRLPVFNTVLAYVLWKGRNSGGNVAALCESPAPLPVSTAEQRARARTSLWQYAFDRQMSADEKDGLVERVAAMVGVDYEDIRSRGLLQIMSPETVRALPPELVDVQLHTHRHRTPRDRDLFLREITDNITITRELRGADLPLDHFCYPSGEYFGEYLGWLRDSGVRYATTCVPDLASRATDPLLLPRFVDTTDQSDLAFEAWTSGFAALLPRRKEYRLDQGRLTVLPKRN